MTQPPVNLADRPATQDDSPALEDAAPGLGAEGPAHDLLSELLRSVRLNGERVVAYAPPPMFSMGFADVGSLHIVEEGELELRIDGSPQVERVGRGDVILLPRGDAHHLRDAGEHAEPARWLCGTFTIGDPQASHLLGSLPPVILLGGARTPAPEGLHVARKMLGIEMHSPSQGSAIMIARILDLIFVQILRVWASREDAEPNWLAGAFDPQIGLTLSAIHRDPAHDWTVEELAQTCNLSRSSFAERFAARVGKPPATYLAHVRLDVATTLLRDTSLPVTHIAEKVGYTSEAAFSRAFKNRYSTPPARWRREMRGG
ncbi:AraC family transcriptional regulator [Nocardia alni]|uniref:AraC family transcriptional regulator n=1 Tax=Nocardia alni TaxID=2815723 RepID=UPI001C21A0E6|nr:AraC family transcriptional regulator [Nocardia alni]